MSIPISVSLIVGFLLSNRLLRLWRTPEFHSAEDSERNDQQIGKFKPEGIRQHEHVEAGGKE